MFVATNPVKCRIGTLKRILLVASFEELKAIILCAVAIQRK